MASNCTMAMWSMGVPAGTCMKPTYQGDRHCPGHGGRLPFGLREALESHFGAATIAWWGGYWRVTKCFDGITIVQADFSSGHYTTNSANVPGWSDAVNAATEICAHFERT